MKDKKVIIDEMIFTNIEMVSESKNDGNTNTPLILRGVIQKAGVKNANNRIYPKHILKRAVDDYIKSKVDTRSAVGELDHPDRSDVSLANVCHIINKIWWEGDNVLAEMEIIDDTPAGNILKSLYKKKIKIGISSRALGSVKYDPRTGCDVVEDDLEFICWDYVSTPSTPGANPKLVTESVSHNANDSKKRDMAHINTTIRNIFQDLKDI